MINKIRRRISRVLSLPKGLGNFSLDALSYFLKNGHVFGMPVNAIIEPTNICDQNCPVCETGAGLLKRKKGSMTLASYKIIIDKLAPFINTALLYYMGEPFLNKEIYDIIAYTKGKSIFTKICTNGQNIDPRRLLDSGLNELQFQIGGITQGTHSIYRRNSELQSILGNIRSLVEEKKARIDCGEKVATNICLGLIVMKHNEHEIKDFYKLAGELGVMPRIESPCVRTIEQGNAFLPENQDYWLYDRSSFRSGVLKHKHFRPHLCRWIYYALTITWDGDVIPCCRDIEANYKIGNLLKNDLRDIWNGKCFYDFRKNIKSNRGILPMCLPCDGLTLPSLQKI